MYRSFREMPFRVSRRESLNPQTQTRGIFAIRMHIFTETNSLRKRKQSERNGRPRRTVRTNVTRRTSSLTSKIDGNGLRKTETRKREHVECRRNEKRRTTPRPLLPSPPTREEIDGPNVRATSVSAKEYAGVLLLLLPLPVVFPMRSSSNPHRVSFFRAQILPRKKDSRTPSSRPRRSEPASIDRSIPPFGGSATRIPQIL